LLAPPKRVRRKALNANKRRAKRSKSSPTSSLEIQGGKHVLSRDTIQVEKCLKFHGRFVALEANHAYLFHDASSCGGRVLRIWVGGDPPLNLPPRKLKLELPDMRG
jgi:hypothetical protein